MTRLGGRSQSMLQQPRTALRLELSALLAMATIVLPAVSQQVPPPWWREDASGVRVTDEAVVFVTSGADPGGPEAKALKSLLAASQKDLEAEGLKVMESNSNTYIWGNPATRRGGRMIFADPFVGVVFFSQNKKRPESHKNPKSSKEILLAADLFFEAP